jgi:acyl-CoA reductase-like NAD-dependent aldehyde dehydrogenase
MDYPMIIGGERVKTASRRSVRLPYDGSEYAGIYEAGQTEVDAAVAAAAKAFPVMSEMTREERSAILRKAHYRLLEQKEDMALTIASESGKPLKEARVEVDRAAYTLLFSSEEAHRLAGEVVPMDAHPAGRGHMGFMTREPLGVIAAITPFNFPLNLSMHKIGPAIAAGNAVVHKPASSTPVCALKMAEILHDCGLPAGALNVITGPGGAIGEQLVFDRRIVMITFTGSADVGLRIGTWQG